MLKKAFWHLIDFVIPQRCILCQEVVVSPGYVCGACWGKLTFITQPYCAQCGFPLEIDIAQDTLCGACLKTPPVFQEARSVLVYDDMSKLLVLKFKHGDGTYLAPAFVDWMCHIGQDLFEKSDFLLPVPLHWKRLIRRRYNQAALLVNGLARKTRLPALMNVLKRHENTQSQGHLSKQARERNVKNAFSIHPKHAALLNNKRVILIDDVYTSGATLQACSRTLLQSGVQSVAVLTLARVVQPSLSA